MALSLDIYLVVRCSECSSGVDHPHRVIEVANLWDLSFPLKPYPFHFPTFIGFRITSYSFNFDRLSRCYTPHHCQPF